ncbi:hypothetical protein PaG_01443 [Moesziomyces aphidis]|uniref:Uncharacterized protein n=1 Tax=Moesziomyces aphidis TaxID=84754 RepID=W3VRM7_MOEAP|nr:hypothetical protein PaG_01443 [Moesziomyces aphidis]
MHASQKKPALASCLLAQSSRGADLHTHSKANCKADCKVTLCMALEPFLEGPSPSPPSRSSSPSAKAQLVPAALSNQPQRIGITPIVHAQRRLEVAPSAVTSGPSDTPTRTIALQTQTRPGASHRKPLPSLVSIGPPGPEARTTSAHSARAINLPSELSDRLDASSERRVCQGAPGPVSDLRSIASR